jgi:hypothetical protein
MNDDYDLYTQTKGKLGRVYDSAIVFILSHGSHRKKSKNDSLVLGVDYKGVSVDVIKSFLQPLLCPAMKGKPKLFFIQACRGLNNAEGDSISTAHTDAMNIDGGETSVMFYCVKQVQSDHSSTE